MSTSGFLSKSLTNSLFVVGAVALVNLAFPLASLADPFKLGAEQKQYNEGGSYPAYPQYPTPQAMPAPRPPIPASVREDVRPTPRMNGGVQDNQPPRRPPIQLQAQRVVLPASFLGAWNVQGQRTKVEALPEFQAGAEAVFAPNTSNVWNIGGDPNSGYRMSNDQGVSTQLVVDKVEGNTAFIRYQHPIKNTVAGEAIVMSLVPGGAQFNGLERVSITKQGEVRAKVTYQLVGRRGR
ncbi:MAG: hypothetical protein C0469_05115 [Cyanobacteria bacterium DS2.3.42]|nr:hypothetical protein [Cyanobacteria bacterium DS2.3.42]